MANHRLYTRLGKHTESLLFSALLGLWMGNGVGQAAQLQGNTIINQARSAAQGASAAEKPVQSKTAKRAPAGRPIPTPMRAPTIVGLRDPFKLPPPPGPAGESSASEELRGPLPPGTRGLVINQLRLEGVVRLDQSNTMIAVVTNYTNRAYFLRENDAVFNGVVSKIGPDSIAFKENYLDQFGRAQVREVVRRLSGAPGEGR